MSRALGHAFWRKYRAELRDQRFPGGSCEATRRTDLQAFHLSCPDVLIGHVPQDQAGESGSRSGSGRASATMVDAARQLANGAVVAGINQRRSPGSTQASAIMATVSATGAAIGTQFSALIAFHPLGGRGHRGAADRLLGDAAENPSGDAAAANLATTYRRQITKPFSS